jgi:hypothetical protein
LDLILFFKFYNISSCLLNLCVLLSCLFLSSDGFFSSDSLYASYNFLYSASAFFIALATFSLETSHSISTIVWLSSTPSPKYSVSNSTYLFITLPSTSVSVFNSTSIFFQSCSKFQIVLWTTHSLVLTEIIAFSITLLFLSHSV